MLNRFLIFIFVLISTPALAGEGSKVFYEQLSQETQAKHPGAYKAEAANRDHRGQDKVFWEQISGLFESARVLSQTCTQQPHGFQEGTVTLTCKGASGALLVGESLALSFENGQLKAYRELRDGLGLYATPLNGFLCLKVSRGSDYLTLFSEIPVYIINGKPGNRYTPVFMAGGELNGNQSESAILDLAEQFSAGNFRGSLLDYSASVLGVAEKPVAMPGPQWLPVFPSVLAKLSIQPITDK